VLCQGQHGSLGLLCSTLQLLQAVKHSNPMVGLGVSNHARLLHSGGTPMYH
jgi:hypothetical protein